MINGVTQLLMMKADVLSVFPTIKVCTKYQLKDGTFTEMVPYELVNEKKLRQSMRSLKAGVRH